jgi:hypothetical protein
MRTKIDEWRPRRACRAGLVLAANVDVLGRRVVDLARDSRVGGPDARARDEPAFRGTGRQIETWLGVITEQQREGGYVIDFTVGQSFGEPQRFADNVSNRLGFGVWLHPNRTSANLYPCSALSLPRFFRNTRPPQLSILRPLTSSSHLLASMVNLAKLKRPPESYTRIAGKPV